MSKSILDKESRKIMRDGFGKLNLKADIKEAKRKKSKPLMPKNPW